jgi:diguanylate cyclase (GGDEF)-like protein
MAIIKRSLIDALITFLDVLIGVILIAYYLIVKHKTEIGNGLLYFGIFAVIMGVWSFCETDLMTLLVQNRIAASFMGFSLVMMMIIPLVLYSRSFLQAPDRFIAPILCIAAVANWIINLVLYFTDVRGLRQTSINSHILLGLAVFYLLYAVICRIRRFGLDSRSKNNIVGFLMLTATAIIDAVQFYGNDGTVETFGRIGLLIFLILMTKEIVDDVWKKIEESKAAKQFEEMAMFDLLTGIYSRNAYDTWCRDKKPDSPVALITFDLNNLKECNDTLGHSAGDRYIRDAAHSIEKIFSEDGKCYRIGGDEFCVVTTQTDEDWIRRRIDELDHFVLGHEIPKDAIRMTMAHGWAVYDGKVDADLEATRSRADEKMYANKKETKRRNLS